MKPEQLDMLLYWVIIAGLVGIAFALLWFVAAKIGRQSARGAGMLAGMSALIYVGVGVAGAAIKGERPLAPAPAGEDKADAATKAEPVAAPTVDPAIEAAAVSLRGAVAAGDWTAAASAHEALAALDASHPELAPAWAKIEAGRAVAGETGEPAGTGGEADSGSSGSPGGESTGTPAVADEGAAEPEVQPEPEPEPEPEPVKTKKKKKKKRRRPAAGDEGDGGDDGSEPEPDPEPEPSDG